jgi:transposase
MAKGRPRINIILNESDQQALAAMLRKRSIGQAIATRAQIVLLCAQGLPDVQVAEQIGVTRATVGTWRKRFIEFGIEGLHDAPRSGAPRTITDEHVEQVIKLTLESKPKDATHWSTRRMAARCGMSQSTITRVWRAFGLKPHLVETFKISSDPFFIEKTKDIVGLYMNPPENAAVFCVDEKSQIQALDRTWPMLPMRPGQVERRTHDYKRHGTTTLFAALNTATGQLLGRCHKRHRSIEFRKFLKEIDKNVPSDLEIHLILDNYATHKTKLIHNWLLKHPRFQLHFIPTSSSWLNMVERWFAELTNKQIKRGCHRSVQELEAAIESYIALTNHAPKPFVWVKTAEQIIESVGRFCSRIYDSGH